MRLLISFLVAINVFGASNRSLVISGSGTGSANISNSVFATIGSTGFTYWTRLQIPVSAIPNTGTYYHFLEFAGTDTYLALVKASGVPYLRVISGCSGNPDGNGTEINLTAYTDSTGLADVTMQFQVGSLSSTIDLWSINGQNRSSNTKAYTSCPNNYRGTLTIGNQNLAGVKIAYLRWKSGAAGTTTNPPQQYTPAGLAAWNFEDTLTDSGPYGMTVTYSGVTFAATPILPPVSRPTVYEAPSWSDWVSPRAGHQQQLDGSQSYAQNNNGSLTYLWTQSSNDGLIWSSKTAVAPTINGLVFGTYNVELQVTDGIGQVSTQALQLGATAQDDKGIVINADPIADAIFGSMMAMGSTNPKNWPWMDAQHKSMSEFFGSLLAPDGSSFADGTLSVTNGSAVVTGFGTDLARLVCSSNTPPFNAASTAPLWVYIYPSSGSRVLVTAASCDSSSQITLSSNWSGSTESGLHYQFAPMYPQWRVPLGTVTLTNGSGNAVRLTGPAWDTSNVCDTSNDTRNLIVFTYTDSDGVVSYEAQKAATCSDDSHMSFVSTTWTHGTGTFNWATWSVGSWAKWIGGSSNFNYYDNVEAHYSLYYRTGNTLYRDYARALADLWIEQPCINYYRTDSYCSTYKIPRQNAWSGIALRANDGRPELWKALRRVLNWYMDSINNPNGLAVVKQPEDLRETGYATQQLAIAALIDPDLTQRAIWQTNLQSALDNRWIGYQITSGATIKWTDYTNNIWENAAQTGDYPAGACTVNLTNGSTTATSSDCGFVSAVCNSGVTLEPRRIAFSLISAIVSNDGLAHMDTASYGCTFVNGTTITLDSAYTGTTGAHIMQDMRYAGGSNLISRQTQPFILGIVANAFTYANRAFTAAGNTTYATIASSYAIGAAQWITDNYWPASKGLFYAIGLPMCQTPTIILASSPPLGQCMTQTDVYGPDGLEPSRDYAGETLGGFASAIQLGAGASIQNRAEMFAGVNFGYPGYGGPQTSDGWYSAQLVPGPGRTVNKPYKYFGFFFGNGFAATLPAALAGGRAQSLLQPVFFSFDLSLVDNAAEIRIQVTQPNGIKDEVRCTTSPCTITVDRLQGAHWISKSYFTATGDLLRADEPQLIDFP